MAKKSPADDREAAVDDEILDEELVDELAAEDVADEEAVTDSEVAVEVASDEAASNENMVNLTIDDVPEGADMDIGDSINTTIELTLKKKNDDGTLEFQVTDVLTPTQEVDLDTAEAEATGPDLPPPPSLGGALGGGGAPQIPGLPGL